MYRSFQKALVLILVLVEDGLGDRQVEVTLSNGTVLILVLVEDGLGVLLWTSI